MSDHTGPDRAVASVLIVAADPNIASLCGELVAFAGHRPHHDFTNGVAGESIRHERPHIAMIDGALECHIVDACVEACDEVRARPVLTSSTASEPELIDAAQRRGCIPFPLPGRPTQLRHILDGALRIRMKPSPLLATWRPRTTIHPAFCAAIAGMARARALMSKVPGVVPIDRHSDMHESLAEMRRTREALRAAVRDYAAYLREKGVPTERMLELVHGTIHECAAIVGEEAAVAPIDGELREWALDAYRVA